MDTLGIVNVSGLCYEQVSISSLGVWNVKDGESILQHSLLRFHLQLLVMFLIANLFHLVLRRLHFSRFTSDFLAGLILGPTIMGNVVNSQSNVLFPPLNDHVWNSLSKIGYMFFVFLAAVQMDTTLMWKTGKKAYFLGILVFATHFAMQTFVEVLFPKGNNLPDTARAGKKFFQMTSFGTMIQTEFVGVCYLLMQLKMINSQLGRLALAASMQSKLLNLALSIIDGYQRSKYILPRVGTQMIILTIVYILFIVTILRQMVYTFIRKTPEGQPLKEIYAIITIAFVFILASSGDSAGLNYIYGPLIFGFVVPARSPLAEVLIAKFQTIVSGFLLPLLTMFCASKIDLHEFVTKFDTLLTFRITLIGFALKLLVTFSGVLFCRIPFRHAAALTVMLNAKGFFELGIFISYSGLKDIYETNGLLLLFLLQAFQPLLLKMLYRPSEHYVSYKQKSVENASDDTGLQILVCAHREEDAIAAITLLEYSNPTKRSPLSIYGLCLEELVSSYIPAIINHQLGQKTSSSEGSSSQPIIEIFKYFKSQHNKLVHMHVFTAISPFKEMHEDICWVSFDKGCSLIIIPFHKKWNSKGKIVSSNTDLRNLNIKVLENAPCSVGILIDRKRTKDMSSIFISSTIYRVAVLFIGGADDKEAIAYALRMARGPKVHLTIMHFIAQDDHDVRNWLNMANAEFIRTLKADTAGQENINIVEVIVKDASDTFREIQPVASDHDLIIVGRRHETQPKALSGLSGEWIELPELGSIGDQLVSEYISDPISVLVVQQHQMKEFFNAPSILEF